LNFHCHTKVAELACVCDASERLLEETVLWIVVNRETGRVTNTQQSLKSRSSVGGTLMSRGTGHSYAPYKKPAMDVRRLRLFLHSVLGTIAGLNSQFFSQFKFITCSQLASYAEQSSYCLW